MRDVAPSAIAAVVIGSRRNRWQAIHNVLAPPSSAARACAGMSVIGTRPSMEMPRSGMSEAIGPVQRAEHVVECAGDNGCRPHRLFDRGHVLETTRRQQHDHTL